MSGLTGIAPLTGLSSLMNATGQPDAGSAARAVAAPAAIDGERPQAAETERPVAAAPPDQRSDGARPDETADRTRERDLAEGRSRREADEVRLADDRAAARRLEAETRARLASGAENANAEEVVARAEDRFRRFVESVGKLDGNEPRDLTPERIAELRAAITGEEPPAPDPETPLVDDGIPVPVDVEVPDFPAEEPEVPFGQDDGIPVPVEPEVGEFPAEEPDVPSAQDDGIPVPVEPIEVGEFPAEDETEAA